MVIILYSPQSGHAEVAEVLLSSSPAADASCRDGKGSTALHLAAINGRAEVAEAILGRIEGAPKKLLLEAPDRQGRTAAHMAAQEDHGGVLRALVEAGAEAGAKDERGMVFLLISLLLNVKKSLHAYFFIISRSPLLGSTPLHYAATTDASDAAAVLLSSPSSLPLLQIMDGDGDTPLHSAAAFGSAGVARRILDFALEWGMPAPDLVLARGKGGRAPLHLAAEWDSVEVLGLMLPHAGGREPR